MKLTIINYIVIIILVCTSIFLFIVNSYIPAVGAIIVLARYVYKIFKRTAREEEK